MESNYSSYEDNCVASVSSADSTTLIEAINLPVVFGNTATNILVYICNQIFGINLVSICIYSGSVCTIINETQANSIISQDPNSKWIREAAPKKFKIFSNELIQTLGLLQTSIQCKNWYANPLEIQIVTDIHRSLLSRDLFPALGLSIQQANNPKTLNKVDQE